MDDTPLHEQERAGRQDQRVEDIRDHEDGIEHDGEAEEDRFVDLEDLGRQGQAADFPIARLLGVPHDERQGDGCAGAANVDEGGEETVGSHIRQRLAGGHRLHVRGQVLQEDRSNDGIHGVVAIDADGPEQCDQEGIHQDPGQRVQGEDHGLKRGLHEVVDVHPEHEANHPEHHHQKEQRAEGQEGLVHHRRHILGQLDDNVLVREKLLHPNTNQGDKDRGEQPLRAEAVHRERYVIRLGSQLELDHQEDHGGNRGADNGLLLQLLAQVIADGEAHKHREQAEGGGDRDLQKLEVGRDDLVPASHRQEGDDDEQPPNDRKRHHRYHPGADSGQVGILAQHRQGRHDAFVQESGCLVHVVSRLQRHLPM